MFNISTSAGRGGRHGQPAARGRLERHRDRKPGAAGGDGQHVYFSRRPGEREAADEVGRLLRRRWNRGCPSWLSNRRAWSWWSPARLLHMLKTVAVAACFAVPALVLSACSAPEQPATTPGTTPSVWTGSPAPSAPPVSTRAAMVARSQPSGEKLTAELKLAERTTVATADIAFAEGYRHRDCQTTVPASWPGLPRPAHPFGRQVRGQFGRPDRRRARRLQFGWWTFPGGGHSGHPASGDLSSLQVLRTAPRSW